MTVAVLGLGLAETLLDGLTDADGETDALGLAEADGDGETDGETLLDGDTEADGLTDGDALGETLDETLDDGPISAIVSAEAITNDRSGRSLNNETREVFAPCNVPPLLLGLGLLDVEADTLLLGLTDADGDTDADGLTLADGEGEGETDGLGELMISRIARCTAARSSEVPEDIPTFLAPCPAVVSRTTLKPLAPTSCEWSAVLLAPVPGRVWWPQ